MNQMRITASSRNRIQIISLIVLAFSVLSILAINLSGLGITLQDHFIEFSVYLILTSFSIVLGVPLSRGRLSVAHVIGMLAFLSLPASSFAGITVSVSVGALVGGVILWQLNQRNILANGQPVPFNHAIFVTAQVTIPFYVAGGIYQAIGATLPLADDITFSTNGLPLVIYTGLYVILYFAIFALQIETGTYRISRLMVDSRLPIATILLLPIPFMLIGTDVARVEQSMIFFAITVVGLALITAGLYILVSSETRMRRQLDEIDSIAETTQALRQSLDLESLLSILYNRINDLIVVEYFTVALLEDDGVTMQYPLVMENGKTQKATDYGNTPQDVELIRYILVKGETLLLNEDFDNQLRKLKIQSPMMPISSWLGVPIEVGNRILGAFILRATSDTIAYSEDDLQLMNIVVGGASIAIENARLYTQKSIRAEQLATLNQVTALLTGTLSPNEVLDTIVSSASTVADASAVSVFLFKKEGHIAPSLERTAGLANDFHQHIATPILSMKDALMGKPSPIAVNNANEYELPDSLKTALRDSGMHSFIELPLYIGHSYLGVMVLYYRSTQVFNAEHLDILEAFATQASQAVLNAREYTITGEALEQRVEQLYALAAISRQVNATMSQAEVYQVIMNDAVTNTNAQRGAIILEKSDDMLEIIANKDFPNDILETPSILYASPAEQVLRTGTANRIDNIRENQEWYPFIPTTLAMLLTPIQRGNETIGVIWLESDTPNAFTDGDSQFTTQLANQAIIALDNTMLFQRVKEARDNLQVILNAMSEALVLIDAKQTITLANPNVSLLGLDYELLQNASLSDFAAQDDGIILQKLGFPTLDQVTTLFEQLSTPTASTDEFPTHRFTITATESDTRYIQRQAIPLMSDDHVLTAVLLVFYNKTEEQELAQARESFSQMIVHDLRSPLTAVTTSLRLLNEVTPQDDQSRAMIELTTDTSRRAIRKVLSRVDALLDISKMESGSIQLELEPVDIHGTVTNVVNELNPLAKENNVTLNMEIGKDTPILNVDPDKIERTILNLVDNAIKYSPKKGVVTIKAVVPDNSDNNTGWLELHVIDEGPGIPDEAKNSLFDRFNQVAGRKSVRRGVGLGLTFCKMVIEAHGGKIWVEDVAHVNGTQSDTVSGSIFKVTLPLYQIELMR